MATASDSSASPTATSEETTNQLHVPSSVISIGIGFVGFAAAFVCFGFVFRVVMLRRAARARGEVLPTFGDVFIASMGGVGRGGGRYNMYMNRDAPWNRIGKDEDFGPKPEIWDVKMVGAERQRGGQEKDAAAASLQDALEVPKWQPISVRPRYRYPRKANPFTLSTTSVAASAATSRSGTPTPAGRPPLEHPVHVSLFIAMPTPSLCSASSSLAVADEECVPDCCFGITEVVAMEASSRPASRVPSSLNITRIAPSSLSVSNIAQPSPSRDVRGLSKAMAEVQHVERVG